MAFTTASQKMTKLAKNADKTYLPRRDTTYLGTCLGGRITNFVLDI